MSEDVVRKYIESQKSEAPQKSQSIKPSLRVREKTFG